MSLYLAVIESIGMHTVSLGSISTGTAAGNHVNTPSRNLVPREKDLGTGLSVSRE